jgi:hypothetical protein
MRRLAVVAVTVAAGLGMSACGAAQPVAQAQEVVEARALTALGYGPDDMVPVAEPDPSASARPGAQRRHAARVLPGRNTLHGEVVVQTKEGVQTVLVQRGEVTAVDGDSVTVTSSDGFALTWTYAEDLRVVERRATVQPDALGAGDTVGVAGAKDGAGGVARLIVVRRPTTP